jgi:hypothetical protein
MVSPGGLDQLFRSGCQHQVRGWRPFLRAIFDTWTGASLTFGRRPFLTNGQAPFIFRQNYSETFAFFTWGQHHFDSLTAAILTCIWSPISHSQHFCEVYCSFLRIKSTNDTKTFKDDLQKALSPLINSAAFTSVSQSQCY